MLKQSLGPYLTFVVFYAVPQVITSAIENLTLHPVTLEPDHPLLELKKQDSLATGVLLKNTHRCADRNWITNPVVVFGGFVQ